MEVVALDAGSGLLEANVVKAGEAGPVDVLDGVVRHQEVLLPPHEDKVGRVQRVVVKVVRIKGFCILIKSNELALKRKASYYHRGL